MSTPPPRPAPPKVATRSWSPAEAVDGAFFVLATALVLWLGWLLLTRALTLDWQGAAYLVAFWLLLAYVALPRLQQVLTRIYVPDYFIGRTVTTSGLLGDPVNLALQGDADQIHTAMQAAGWIRADPVTLRSSWGIVVSSVLRRSYDAAPVSPLLLFGRPQAFAYQQEVGGSASQRHHVRFWPTPDGWLLPGGHRVAWLAAGTFDRAVGLSLFTLQVTHKIDADIDVERDHVVATVQAAVPSARVQVLRDFVSAFRSRNGGGDVVHTDGDLVVLDLTAVPVLPSPAATAVGAAARRGGLATARSFAAHRLPPPELLIAGALSLVKSVGGALALGLVAVPSAVVVALWLATLARQAWARALLMLVCAVDAGGHLVEVSASEGHPGLARLLYAGASLLILIVVSSDDARRWVTRPPATAPS